MICAEHGLIKEQFAYIGGDLNDLPVPENAGLSGCPSNAMKVVKQQVAYICKKECGDGTFREFSKLVLEHQQGSIFLH